MGFRELEDEVAGNIIGGLDSSPERVTARSVLYERRRPHVLAQSVAKKCLPTVTHYQARSEALRTPKISCTCP